VGEYRLIGEDLGTVPDYVRPSLTSLGIAGFKVPQWETRWDTHLIPGEEYQRLSVATFATHDHEPVRAQWERWMAVIERAEHDHSEEVLRARDWTWWEVRRMSAWAGFEVPCITPFNDEVHERLLGGLFACNSWLAICMITDLFASTQRFNVPGAISESNWSQRLSGTVRSWREDEAVRGKMRRLRALLEQTGRLA
jgi:4-alpha-glucanotransferase